jgi:hypothetical protein
MLACRQPGCSSSTCVSRVGRSTFSGRAGAVKNRYASKWLHRTPCSSTVVAMLAGVRRNGQALWRTSA